MKKEFFWRISLIVLATVLSIVFFLPSTQLSSSLPEWLQKYGIVLGLDLQGGVHLVYEVDGEKAVEITTERLASSIGNTLKEEKIEADVKQDGLKIVVSSTNEKAYDTVAGEFGILTEDSRVDGAVTYTLQGSEIDRIKALAIDQALETIRNRVDQFGVAEPTIHRQAENEIVIQLPGVKDTKRAIELVGKTAILEFKILDDEAPVAAQIPGVINP
ncbi:MAG: protein translocase subunit SecD, partial [Nitrospiraceae bacterium]